MKKWLCMTTVALLCMLCATGVCVELERAFLSARPDCAIASLAQNGNTAASVLTDGNGKNILCIAQRRDGQWQVTVQNAKALDGVPKLALEQEDRISWTYEFREEGIRITYSAEYAAGEWGAVQAERVYASEPSGLFLTGERTFDTYAPAVIERTNVHDLLSPAWNVLAEEEILQTASFSQAVGDNMIRELLMANLTAAKVIHTDWVNLRSRGDIQSPSIGEILAGDVVYVLAERQGTENGWTQVIWMPENSAARMGYIWWSFLEKQQN